MPIGITPTANKKKDVLDGITQAVNTGMNIVNTFGSLSEAKPEKGLSAPSEEIDTIKRVQESPAAQPADFGLTTQDLPAQEFPSRRLASGLNDPAMLRKLKLRVMG